MDVQSQFYDHEVVQKSPDDYVEITLSPTIILNAWSTSMFAHELLNKDGSVKSQNDLKDATLQKFIDANETIKRGENLPKPIIGVGIMDGVEIGIGREIIAAAAKCNIAQIPVCIRKAQADDVKAMLKL